MARHFLVKWWDKFSVERIIKFINEEFPKKLHLQEKEKHSSSKSSIESILEGKSSKELTEIAKQILARAVSQERSPASSKGFSSNKQIIFDSSQPGLFFEDSQDPYEDYDLGED